MTTVEFDDVAQDLVKAQDKALHEYLLEYFGDYATATECAKYFTVETEERSYVHHSDTKTDEYWFRAEILYRVRVKSEEELENSHILKPWPEEVVILQEIEEERRVAMENRGSDPCD